MAGDDSKTMDVAIIGGGIAGLVLALTLHKHSIKSTIYELRETADIANPGSIAVAPNALRALDKLGLHGQLRAISWPLYTMQFRNEADVLFCSIDVGGTDKYGYDALRLVRRRLHTILLTAVTDANISIISGKKFSHVTTTTPSTITFAFTDTTQATHTLLIGADGIHSTVRKTFLPDIIPEYRGSLTLAAVVRNNPLLTRPQTPTLLSRLHSVSITNGAQASFVAIPQSPSGEEIALAHDRPFPPQSRAEWDALLADPQRQYEMFMEGYDEWPEIIQTLMRAVTPDDMYRSWPYYAIPALPSWTAHEAKVVLIGDAAHAIPPSAGQGACMAVEDAWSLGLVLAQCVNDKVEVGSDAFQTKMLKWQNARMERVDLVRTLTRQMGNARLPKETRDALGPDEVFDGETAKAQEGLRWLYGYEFRVDGL